MPRAELCCSTSPARARAHTQHALAHPQAKDARARPKHALGRTRRTSVLAHVLRGRAAQSTVRSLSLHGCLALNAVDAACHA
eukprot:2093182-Pleurochrysis_carterae.AAC.3